MQQPSPRRDGDRVWGGSSNGWNGTMSPSPDIMRPGPLGTGGVSSRSITQPALHARSCSPHSDEDLEDLVACTTGLLGGVGSVYGRTNSGVSVVPGRPHVVVAQLSLPSSQRVTPGKDAMGPMLAINVGGDVFSTTRSTLQRAPFFESMFRHEGDMNHTVDERGRFFVDRSSELFRYILDYLRTSHWILKERCSDLDFIEALRDEACFYGLDVAAQLPVPPICEYVTIWQFREDIAIYVDCMEQTLRDDPDHQGSFRLCKYFGSLPLDAKTSTKRFKASSHSLQAVLAYFAMRGWGLKNVVDGSMITHTTSADGQSRNGMGIQYILEKQGVIVRAAWTPPSSQRADQIPGNEPWRGSTLPESWSMDQFPAGTGFANSGPHSVR